MFPPKRREVKYLRSLTSPIIGELDLDNQPPSIPSDTFRFIPTDYTIPRFISVEAEIWARSGAPTPKSRPTAQTPQKTNSADTNTQSSQNDDGISYVERYNLVSAGGNTVRFEKELIPVTEEVEDPNEEADIEDAVDYIEGNYFSDSSECDDNADLDSLSSLTTLTDTDSSGSEDDADEIAPLEQALFATRFSSSATDSDSESESEESSDADSEHDNCSSGAKTVSAAILHPASYAIINADFSDAANESAESDTDSEYAPSPVRSTKRKPRVAATTKRVVKSTKPTKKVSKKVASFDDDHEAENDNDNDLDKSLESPSKMRNLIRTVALSLRPLGDRRN